MYLKNLRLILASAAVIILLLISLLSHNHHSSQPTTKSACSAYRSDKTVRVGSQRITAEVADTPAERSKGLGGRACITPSEGMLFVFDKPGRLPIWMKDMKFPLDIVWIDSDHKAVAIEVNVSPSTYPDSFVNKDKPAQFVLELQAERSKSLGINLGTPINF